MTGPRLPLHLAVASAADPDFLATALRAAVAVLDADATDPDDCNPHGIPRPKLVGL